MSADYAYIADGFNGLQVIDISDQTNPTIVGSVDTSDQATGVTVSGDYAYVADGDRGLQIIDIRDPTNPAIVGLLYSLFRTTIKTLIWKP
ncbi:MAG: hypothetical protein GY874_05975 [Desulfobacteraceae bacterium]|nr:hypothetical protein [Desulfobacteraceae bacterium]